MDGESPNAPRENSTLGDVPRYVSVNEASPTAAYEFARAASLREDIVGAASGVFDGRFSIWLFLDDMDVAATRALFDLQSSFEERHQEVFEIHVDALQGRALVDAVPPGYRLLSYR